MILTELNIHNSDIGQFKRCRQLWDWTSNIRHNLEAIPSSPNALWFGSGIHLGLYYYYSHERSTAMALKAWDKYCEQAPFPVPEDGDHSYQLGAGMLVYFGDKWAPVNDKLRFVEAEEERILWLFSTEKYSVNLSYRLDGLFQDDRGRWWVREYKTAKSLPSNTDYLNNDDQSGRYLMAEEERHGGKIAGVDYIILKKGYPQPLNVNKNGKFSVDKRQETTYDVALAQMKEAYLAEYPTGLMTWTSYKSQYREYLDYLLESPNGFVRQIPVTRNPQEIKGVKTSLLWEIEDMINDPKIYRNPSAYNCNGCAFYNPCVTRWEGRDFNKVLSLGYRKRESYQSPEVLA